MHSLVFLAPAACIPCQRRVWRPPLPIFRRLQVMVYGDCHRKLRELMERHNLSASGAAHHLMRLGAGLSPLPPLDQQPSTRREEPTP